MYIIILYMYIIIIVYTNMKMIFSYCLFFTPAIIFGLSLKMIFFVISKFLFLHLS